ncbi:hypothetical protein [Streptomyces sp. NPDC057545]|uniref:hypothetical protein n=1 Tax=Streptomyces sp. NPDC057545 TaxID=3346164 RepID=UPI00368C989D
MTFNGGSDLTDIPATRAAYRAQAESIAESEPDDPSVTTEEHRVGRAVGPEVPVRLLRPATAQGPLPVMLWFHGGGQVLGFAAQDDPWIKRLTVVDLENRASDAGFSELWGPVRPKASELQFSEAESVMPEESRRDDPESESRFACHLGTVT